MGRIEYIKYLELFDLKMLKSNKLKLINGKRMCLKLIMIFYKFCKIRMVKRNTQRISCRLGLTLHDEVEKKVMKSLKMKLL